MDHARYSTLYIAQLFIVKKYLMENIWI